MASRLTSIGLSLALLSAAAFGQGGCGGNDDDDDSSVASGATGGTSTHVGGRAGVGGRSQGGRAGEGVSGGPLQGGAPGEEAGAGGDLDVSGAGNGGADAAGAGGTPGCRTEYDLASYGGDISTLCAAELSTQCDCGDVAHSIAVECPPGHAVGDGDCVKVSQYCSEYEPLAECDWTVCADASCLDQYDEIAVPCASNDDCRAGRCSKRIADRMFCVTEGAP